MGIATTIMAAPKQAAAALRVRQVSTTPSNGRPSARTAATTKSPVACARSAVVGCSPRNGAAPIAPPNASNRGTTAQATQISSSVADDVLAGRSPLSRIQPAASLTATSCTTRRRFQERDSARAGGAGTALNGSRAGLFAPVVLELAWIRRPARRGLWGSAHHLSVRTQRFVVSGQRSVSVSDGPRALGECLRSVFAGPYGAAADPVPAPVPDCWTRLRRLSATLGLRFRNPSTTAANAVGSAYSRSPRRTCTTENTVRRKTHAATNEKRSATILLNTRTCVQQKTSAPAALVATPTRRTAEENARTSALQVRGWSRTTRSASPDETFLLLSGRLTIQLRTGDVDLAPGDLFVIPRGVEHCPLAHEEARFLLVGPEVTSTAAGGKPDWSADGGRPPESTSR
jgi:mannose-6-phosphate isomerase-like protein (cupin superfamily)